MSIGDFFDCPDGSTSSEAGFLTHFTGDELARVLQHAQPRHYARGETAVSQGENDRSLSIVTKGRFEVLVHGEDGKSMTQHLCRGDIFGELAFFDNEARSADVRAVEDSEVLIMTPDGLEKLRLVEPRLAFLFVMDLGRMLSLKFRESNRRFLSTTPQ